MAQVSTELNKIDAPQELDKLILSAQVRSRRIRIVTVMLLLGLVCVGVFVFVRQREAGERIKEAQQSAEHALAIQMELEAQAERARSASMFIASGAQKAGRGNFKGALADYDQALSLDPNNPGALSLEGYLKLRMGDTQSGEELLRRSVQSEPNEPWHHYNLALAFWENGKHDEAIAELGQVLQLAPGFKRTIADDRQFRKFRSDARFRTLIGP